MSTVDILLVGLSGNGKSSTGNSILKKKAFNLRSVNVSEIQSNSNENVTVVDGLSLGETDDNDEKSVMSILKLAETAMSMFINGFTALCIILKYGTRFTQQEKDVVRMIKSLFGADVIRDYGVIIMTYGDSFDLDMEDESTTFEEWCKMQTGDIQKLFQECDNRYVLFNNKTKETKLMEQQNEQLMSKISKIKKTNSRYNKDSFMQAESSQNKLLVERKLPRLEQETTEFLNNENKQLQQLLDRKLAYGDLMKGLDDLTLEINKYKKYLHHEDKDTGSIVVLLNQISLMETSVENKRKIKELMHQLPAPQADNQAVVTSFIRPTWQSICRYTSVCADFFLERNNW